MAGQSMNEALNKTLAELQERAEYLEDDGVILSSLVEDFRRGSSCSDELEDLAGLMVEDSVRFAALLGSILEFERLMKAHGLETLQEQQITGDDETTR